MRSSFFIGSVFGLVVLVRASAAAQEGDVPSEIPRVTVEAATPLQVVASSPRGSLTAGDLAAIANAAPAHLRAAWIDPAERARWTDAVVQEWALADEAREQGLAEDPVVRREIDHVIARAYAARLVGATQPRPTAEEIQRYYDAHLETFTRPARVRAQVIVLSKRDEAVRQATRLRRANERRFGAAARRFSIDRPSQARSGSFGWLSVESQVDPALLAAAMALSRDGEVSSVIASTAGDRFYVVRRQERQEAEPLSLDSVRETIASRIQDESRRRRIDEETRAILSRRGCAPSAPASVLSVRVAGAEGEERNTPAPARAR